jgi:glyoxylase-like metal-dependent hydrolase (beta-lactamase superfamily II)
MCVQLDAETVLTTFNATPFGDDFLIIGTPGHTEGHCVLLYKNKFLCWGDTMTSRARFDEPIEACSPLYCWYDWDTFTESLDGLTGYDFEWLLPGHGRHLGISHPAAIRASCASKEAPVRVGSSQHLPSFSAGTNHERECPSLVPGGPLTGAMWVQVVPWLKGKAGLVAKVALHYLCVVPIQPCGKNLAVTCH